jgi:PASTA domain
MAVRLGALLPRVVVVSVVWILASGTLTFAAERQLYAHVAAKAAAPATRPTLVVPDVRSQAFIFAKGILADGGFAWHVVGPVHGYSTNLVASQEPAPGTKLDDTGAPTIVLHLSKGRYAESGEPQDDAPYVGTAIRLAGAAHAQTKKPAAGKVPLAPPKVSRAKNPVHAVRVRAKRAAAKPHKTAVHRARRLRPAAFHVPGAPREPLGEISLPGRANRLSAWLTPSRRPTAANERHWLYQHAWIVAGARFGWWHGAAALRVLIRVDRRVESQWGVGYRSESVARAALAAVQARAK